MMITPLIIKLDRRGDKYILSVVNPDDVRLSEQSAGIDVDIVERITCRLLTVYENLQISYTKEAYNDLKRTAKSQYVSLINAFNDVNPGFGSYLDICLKGMARVDGGYIKVICFSSALPIPFDLFAVDKYELYGFKTPAIYLWASSSHSRHDTLSDPHKFLPHNGNIYHVIGSELDDNEVEAEIISEIVSKNNLIGRTNFVHHPILCPDHSDLITNLWGLNANNVVTHFTCHLTSDDGYPILRMSTSCSFDPSDIWIMDDVKPQRPLLFLNACMPSSLGGRLLGYQSIKSIYNDYYPKYSIGLIGSKTRIREEYANEFVKMFYYYFFEGFTIVEALKESRKRMKKKFENKISLTSLLYTAYGPIDALTFDSGFAEV